MKHLPCMVLLVLVLVAITGCTPVRLKEARAGLETTLADLPQSEELTVITVLSGEYYRQFGDTMCYYGQAIIAVGSSLPVKEALSAYVEQLEGRGWIVKEGNVEFSRELRLVRGEHETITVNMNAPGWPMDSNDEFKRESRKYRSVIIAAVDYDLPSRAACMGE